MLIDAILNLFRTKKIQVPKGSNVIAIDTHPGYKGMIFMIDKQDLLMGRIRESELTPELQQNLDILCNRINEILSVYKQPTKINSGYRTASINNNTPNSAPRSKHLTCQAADLADPDGRLWEFVVANLDYVKRTGLWMEDKRWTPSWVHFQIVPPGSGKRIFVPSVMPPLNEHIWNGVYDKKYD